MENISLFEVIKAVNGKIVGNASNLDVNINKVITDSREKVQNGLFFAIIGENTDGHKYIKMAKENGALATVISKELEEYEQDLVYILVKDTINALKELATWYRQKFSIPVVAITGSVGKTTTKEMIATVLEAKFNVLKTAGNLNSEIGAPLTVLNLNNTHNIAVIEMGMDHLGQIDSISKIIKPDTAVISNIGVAHIEYLKSRENILKAKTEVFNNMSKAGTAILNMDDDMLQTINYDINKAWFGYNEKADVCASNVLVDYTEGIVNADVCVKNCIYKLTIPGFSKHLVYAALAAISVGIKYGVEISACLEAISKFKGIKMRMDIKKLDDGILLIDDTYNANPVSMTSLIDTISLSNKKNKTIIMGDMYELGNETLQGHIIVIRNALKANIDNVIIIGEHMQQAYNTLDDEEKNKVKFYDTKDMLYKHLDRYIIPESVIGVKASRGMKFEDIINKFTN